MVMGVDRGSIGRGKKWAVILTKEDEPAVTRQHLGLDETIPGSSTQVNATYRKPRVGMPVITRSEGHLKLEGRGLACTYWSHVGGQSSLTMRELKTREVGTPSVGP